MIEGFQGVNLRPRRQAWIKRGGWRSEPNLLFHGCLASSLVSLGAIRQFLH